MSDRRTPVDDRPLEDALDSGARAVALYQDKHVDLTARLGAIKAEEARVVPLVVRGAATADTLRELQGQRLEVERALELNTQLLTAARVLCAEQTAQARKRRYDETVDQVEGRFARAPELAARLEASIAESASLLAALRAMLDSTDLFRDVADERVFRHLDNANRLTDLAAFVSDRVILAGLAEGRVITSSDPARRFTLREWVAEWTPSVIRIARQYAERLGTGTTAGEET